MNSMEKQMAEANKEIDLGAKRTVETAPGSFHEETQKQRLIPYLQDWSSNTPDKIVVLNSRFEVQVMNPAAITHFEEELANPIGRACRELLRCRNLNQTELCGTSGCPLLCVFQQQKPFIQEDLIVGSAIYLSSQMSVSVTPTDIDGESYAVFSMHNISSSRIANFIRSNFISMVSHELRTPLTSVHGFIDLLLDGYMGSLNNEQQMYLGYTQEGVQQLISIVEDILFMTRADVGQFEIKPQEIYLYDLVNSVVISMQPQARKSGVLLVLDIPTETSSLYIDPQRIKQVLLNLVSNAIKFTPSGGTVTIRSYQHDKRFDMVEVADTGFGISSADRQYIFERFYQSNHVLQSKLGGYGLGLAIAKLIIEQHGGTIDFDSVPNKGTTFYFSVPRYRE